MWSPGLIDVIGPRSAKSGDFLWKIVLPRVQLFEAVQASNREVRINMALVAIEAEKISESEALESLNSSNFEQSSSFY